MQQDKYNILSIDCDYIQSPTSFNNVNKFFMKYIDQVDLDNIVFSQTHSNIYYILHPLFKQNKSIDLLNIDHHHDIWYFPEQEPIDSYKASNWLGYYLKKRNFVENVFWLANYESTRNVNGCTPIDDLVHITYNIDDVSFEKFDYIFVCNSPLYTSILGDLCYETLVNIVMHSKKCDRFDFYKPNITNHITKEIVLNE